MTPEVRRYVDRWMAERRSGKTLDCGSYDVNGCVRNLFPDYTGLDCRPGPNVDVVASTIFIPFPDSHFDNVLSLEMLEHDPNPFKSVAEMKRVLKPGGHLLLTTCGITFPRHDFPSDYWRFTIDGLALLFGELSIIDLYQDRDHVYGVGAKVIHGNQTL